MSCGVGRRRSSDLALLWLWCRPAETAPIRPLALEPPHATGVALVMAKRQRKRKNTPPPKKKTDLEVLVVVQQKQI